MVSEGGEDVLRKHRVLLPSYVYAYNPWYGYYPTLQWQECEVEYWVEGVHVIRIPTFSRSIRYCVVLWWRFEPYTVYSPPAPPYHGLLVYAIKWQAAKCSSPILISFGSSRSHISILYGHRLENMYPVILVGGSCRSVVYLLSLFQIAGSDVDAAMRASTYGCFQWLKMSSEVPISTILPL